MEINHDLDEETQIEDFIFLSQLTRLKIFWYFLPQTKQYVWWYLIPKDWEFKVIQHKIYQHLEVWFLFICLLKVKILYLKKGWLRSSQQWVIRPPLRFIVILYYLMFYNILFNYTWKYLQIFLQIRRFYGHNTHDKHRLFLKMKISDWFKLFLKPRFRKKIHFSQHNLPLSRRVLLKKF